MPAARNQLIRTPEEAFEAGRALSRHQGVTFTDAQVARFAAILRPHINLWRDDAGEAA